MSRRTVLIAAGCLILLILAGLFGFHRSYSPGPLVEGHGPFASNCAACHEPWRGVETASRGCIDCHGDLDGNPHHQTKLDDKSSGLIAGKDLAGFDNNLACLSCHTDHRGRIVNIAAQAGDACAWCHQHDSIDNVSAHGKKPMQLARTSMHLFAGSVSNGATQLFSHKGHLQDTIDKLAKAKEMAAKARSASRKKQAEADVTALTAMLDPAGNQLNCQACHAIRPAAGGQIEELSFQVAGCKTAGCHTGWRDDALKLTSDAPDFASQQNAAAAEPALIRYLAASRTPHIEALFAHSPGHLRSPCGVCHLKIEDSAKVGDLASRKVANCFSCHAHQSGNPAKVASAISIAGVAFAEDQAESETRITACASCHAFHMHGPNRERDFAHKAPIVRPHQPSGLRLAAYTIGFTHPRDSGSVQLGVRPITLRPWWLGLIAFAVLGLTGVAYVRYLPSGPSEFKLPVAQRVAKEVADLDDTYQSSVPGLYIVGEAGGTASINLAMRSGRQAVDIVANALKFAKAAPAPDVYDVAIIGCGPAGISATTTAKARGLNYVAIERLTPVATIRAYPRGKFVQATPIDIADYGSFFMEGDDSKETLIQKWDAMVAQTGVQINDREEVTRIARDGDRFAIRTASGKSFPARYVILSIGVRGSPRQLKVPGETPDRVFYNLVEPREYQDKRILIVGGGNAGCEVAQALAAAELRNTVSYSFRDPVLGPPVTRENAEKISALQQNSLLTAYPSSEVREIKPGKLVIAPRSGGGPAGGAQKNEALNTVTLTGPVEIDNDCVFAMLGADPPTAFLKSIGVRLIKKGK